MGWTNTHVKTTKPIKDIKGHLIPAGTEFISIYGTKREALNTARFRSCENGKLYEFSWNETKKMQIQPEKIILAQPLT